MGAGKKWNTPRKHQDKIDRSKNPYHRKPEHNEYFKRKDYPGNKRGYECAEDDY